MIFPVSSPHLAIAARRSLQLFSKTSTNRYKYSRGGLQMENRRAKIDPVPE
jgi:hypothetical protein